MIFLTIKHTTMKKFIAAPIILAFLFLSGNMNAQTIAAKTSATPSPTPQSVLAWARELSPELEKALPKLKKINPVTEADRKSKERFLKAAQLAKEIIGKGTKIKTSEAKNYDTWFRLALSESLDECLTQNPGSECCFAGQYHGQGWGGMWYRANCFTIGFPNLN
jgi:hypothetical protein